MFTTMANKLFKPMIKNDFVVFSTHSINFPRGVENGWGLTKVAAVLLNGLLWLKMIYILKLHLYADILSCDPKKY